MSRLHALLRVLPLALVALAAPAAAQGTAQPAEEEPTIEANGFLVEEAYNQEAGVLQQIARAAGVHDGSWRGVYSQEWPIFSERHQLELAVGVAEHDGLAGLGAEYRYLAVGGKDEPFSLSPALEVAWGLVEVEDGETESEWEIEATLPASLRLGETLVANTNLGMSYTPETGDTGFRLGQGLIWRAHPRLNLLLEGVFTRGDPLLREEEGEDESAVVSPGVQFAFPLRDDVQLVPGVAFPFGVGPSAGERAVMLYLSLEHPFTRRR